MKGISYLSEEFVFVLEGRMPLRRILCKRTNGLGRLCFRKIILEVSWRMKGEVGRRFGKQI